MQFVIGAGTKIRTRDLLIRDKKLDQSRDYSMAAFRQNAELSQV